MGLGDHPNYVASGERDMGPPPESKGSANRFTGVKVFSATMFAQRDQLGEKATEWIRANSRIVLVDTVVTQSSDSQFHCITLTFFYRGELG